MDQSETQPQVSGSVASVKPNAQVVAEQAADSEHPPGGSCDSIPTSRDKSGYPDRFKITRVASYRGDVLNVIRGFCMGAADTVPGVSGGTIALIMGHYSRLVTAISHFDSQFLQLVMSRQIDRAARHIDYRFLQALGCGILIGVVTLSGLMHYLLDVHLSETLAVFLGLLVASLWVVVQYVDRWSLSRILACGGGIIVAALISALPTGHGSMSLPFLFFAAAVAICAMILPGISGAFVLLVLGVYHPITGLIKNLVKLQVTMEGFLQLVVFASGCAFGLLAFSRLLRQLLKRAPGLTMAALMGLMIGSVGKLWPLQVPTPETSELEPKYRVMQYVSPSDWNGSLVTLVALALGSALVVLAIEWIATRRTGRSIDSSSPTSQPET